MQINIAVGTNRFGLFTCNTVGKDNTCCIVGREISAGVGHHMRDLEVEPIGNIRDWKGMKRSTKKGLGRTALFREESKINGLPQCMQTKVCLLCMLLPSDVQQSKAPR